MAVAHSILITLLLLLLLLLMNKGSCIYEECTTEFNPTCGPNKPFIQFPFQLVKGSQDQCLYPEFCLYCNENNKTMIEFSNISGPTQFVVSDINYSSKVITISDPDTCFPKKFLELELNRSSSFLPYRFYSESEKTMSIVFFNCSLFRKQHFRNNYQSSHDLQDMITCPIYASSPFKSVIELDIVSCTKMFDVNAAISGESLMYNLVPLSWPALNCTECEAKGNRCRWNNNSTKRHEIECFNCNGKRKTIHIPKSLIFTTIGSIISGLVIFAITKIYLHFREKEEDQVRIDKFLEDFRAEKPTRFSYADIKRITGGFKEKLGEGAHGTVFKGKLSSEILVAVKILNNTQGEGKEFITEVEIMGKIHHINVVRLLGFCAEGMHRALVYNLFPKGSLQSFIFPPDNKDGFMGWAKLQQISIGIAKGIEYLHEGCSHPILHFDINPHNVLLDDTFTPKISDFGLAKLCAKNISVVSMTAARGTLGYMAPEVLSRNFGNVSLKSDIYSYGMLLLEMVGGRKNVDSSSAENLHILYPEWIHNLLQGDIHINIEDEAGNVKIAKKLAIVGLWCIQWQPMNRPSIKNVIQMLETEDDNQLTFPPNPFHSTNSITTSEGSLTRRPFQMEVIQE